jgi:DegV family protein with EDD domain
MAGIRVVTDSAADLERRTVDERGISVVDLDVRLGDIGPEVTREWSPEEFWRQCAKTSVLPETSAPSPGAFAAAYEAAAEDGADGVVCITLSSKLSATYQAAEAGAQAVAGRIPVKVIDSLLVTMAEGLVVLAAVEAAERGGDLETVTQAATSAASRSHVLGTIDTLDNLRKGGRIGGAQALVGSLLSIKPVIEVRDGVVEPTSRQRTRQRSFEFLAQRVREAGPLEQLSIVHAVAADVDVFVDLVAKDFDRDRILLSIIGPVIGTHAGPGTVGVCFETAAE